jgi:hypothetical protein
MSKSDMITCELCGGECYNEKAFLCELCEEWYCPTCAGKRPPPGAVKKRKHADDWICVWCKYGIGFGDET